MENSKILKEQRKVVEEVILNDDANQLEQFLIAFKDDDLVYQWNEAQQHIQKHQQTFMKNLAPLLPINITSTVGLNMKSSRKK